MENRLYLKSIIEEVLADDSLITGWELDDKLDKLSSEDDLAVRSISYILETLSCDFDKMKISVGSEIRSCLKRCVLFLSTEDEISISMDSFVKKRKFWFNDFDLDGFSSLALNTVWPFSSLERKKEAEECQLKSNNSSKSSNV